MARTTEIIEQDDRLSALDSFAAAPRESTAMVAAHMATPVEQRVHGAQQVAVRRNDKDVLDQLRLMAAAAGEHWYYRFPVKKKGGTDWIEGLSIKGANSVARCYGNCEIDVRVVDAGSHWIFYARFIDIETGYSYTRPFQQRKNQQAMRADAGRQEDIIFQIGASKATRNVITNALEFYTQFAFDEARSSIVDKIGKKLSYYREKIVTRLAELKVDIRRIEAVRGRPAASWLAPDIALTIAEMQAIQDGMATIDETYPPLDAPPEIPKDALKDFAEVAPSEPESPPPSNGVAPDIAAQTPPDFSAAVSAPETVAYARGVKACIEGTARKAVPGEYRTPERKAEADAWLRGYDEEAASLPERDGGAAK